MPKDHLLVLSTCPDAATAQQLAAVLVDGRLAACVNIVPGLRSVYRWKGARQEGDEHLLLIKTTAARYAALEQAIRERHPYELPEVIALRLEGGLAEYIGWISESVTVKGGK